MKRILSFLIVLSAWAATSTANADIYISGHADLGIGFELGGLHLHLHAEDPIGLYGGGSGIGEYEPGDLMIGVPGQPIQRPAGAQWSFLAPNANDSVWFLPQVLDPLKPYLGMGTEEMDPVDGWSTFTWTFDSLSVVSGDASEFALWQTDQFGTPAVFASTLQPTGNGNSWNQAALGHNHFNYGFTGEGVYDVRFTVTAVNSGVGPIAGGTYSDSASFRFVTGSTDIAAVPEPSSLLLASMMVAGAMFHRRRMVSLGS